MRTEEDLRTSLHRLADSVPVPDELLTTTPSPRPVRRGRTPLVLGAVLATTAVAVGAPVAATHLKDRTDNATAGQEVKADPAWSGWFTFSPPRGMEKRGLVTKQSYQVHTLMKAAGPASASCYLSAHRNGDFDPRTIPESSPKVTVNGVEGRVVTSPTATPVLRFPSEYYSVKPGSTRLSLLAPTVSTVAWQPAPGLWALATCEAQIDDGNLSAPVAADLPQALALAKAVTPARQLLQSPYRIGYLPSQYKVESIRSSSPLQGDPRTGHTFVVDVVNKKSPAGDRSLSPGDGLRISYFTDKIATGQSNRQWAEPDLTINGLPAWYGIGTPVCKSQPKCDPKAALRIEGRGFVVELGAGANTLTAAEVLKVAQGLKFAPSGTDKLTWFDAAIAIP